MKEGGRGSCILRSRRGATEDAALILNLNNSSFTDGKQHQKGYVSLQTIVLYLTNEFFDTAMSRIAAGEEEIFPDSLVERLLSGKHPLKIWRDYRNLTLAALASICNVTTSALSQIEKGKRGPSVALLKRLSQALRCDMDDLTLVNPALQRLHWLPFR